ncbi:MAG: tetratricopeptide repeat protein, partial [Cytophagaceae bacterium]
MDALFLFKEAEHVLKEAIKLAEKESNNENSAKAFLDISLYLVETGNLLQALAYLEKTKLSETSALRNADGNLVRVKILVKQGFFSHANELLEKQSSFREKNADSASLDQNVFLIKPKEAYAELLILKLQCNIGKGNYKKYEENFPQVKKWINKNLSEYSRSAIKLLELEAKHALFTRNTQQAASLYQQAYQAKQLNYSEISKIENLLELCLRHIEMGHVVHSKKYLRRLHMHAYRKVGKNDPFRIAYEYAKAYQSLHQGDFSSALNRLDKLSKIFAFLPEQHLWNQRIAELSSKLALKSGNIDLYYKGIVNQEKLSGKYYGESSPAYHKTRLALAMYEIRYGNNFRLAEDIINNSYFSIIAKESPEAIENIDYLLAYSELLSYLDNFETAADKSEEAAALAEKIYGLHSPEYLLTFAKHVEFAILAGRYKKGFENLDQAYMLLKNNKHGTHENLQEIMLIFSRMYTLKGEYEKSQTLLSQAYKLSLTGYEQQNLQEADNLENLGSLYLSSGSYFRAEKALLHAFKLRSSSLNEDHPLMLNLYLKLARLHIISGKYDLAEKHLLSSLNIAKNRFGEQSLSYSDCRMVEAEYYVAIGDYKKAELANLEADKIIQAKLGKNNLKRAQVLSELAFIQFRIGKNIGTEIEKRFKEADAIIKNAIGEKNPLSANLYIKLAELYHKSGNAKEAIPLLDYAENYWSEKVGSDNRYTADIHLIRGEIAFLEGKLDQAEKNFKKSQGLYQNIFSDKHTGYVKVTGKLARVYYMQNELSKAFDLMEEIIPTYNDYIIKFFPSLSFREKSKFWNNIREEFEFYNFLALKLTEKSPKLSEKVYNNLILTKALLLNFDIKIRERIFSSKDSILIANYNELIYQKEFLTSAMSLSRQQLIEQKIDLKSVETTIENLEKEISKRSELFSGEEKKRKASYKEIRKTLNDREYAVEIVRYRY